MKKDAEFKGAVPRDKGYKVTDSAGLHLFVSPGGGKSWRFKYTFGGKERRVVFGPYPEITLKRARELRDDAKRLLREGRDPGLESKRARHSRKVGHENTFEMFARSWHEQQKDRWKPVHADDVITSMERDLFPAIGGFPVSEIDEGLLLSALRDVERRGSIETAHRLRQRAERVFRFAAGSGAPNSNPAVNVRDSLKPVPPKKRYPALTDLKDIRALIRAVDLAGASPVTRLCSRFMALVAQRPGMSRNAEWTEFEGLDWGAEAKDASEAIWRVHVVWGAGGGERRGMVEGAAPDERSERPSRSPPGYLPRARPSAAHGDLRQPGQRRRRGARGGGTGRVRGRGPSAGHGG